MRGLQFVVGLLVLGGLMCESAGAAAAGPALYGVVSGSRLRAKFYDGGGGALVFAGWFDSQLGVPCVFQRSRNNQMRCLPAGQPAVWMDATCTMPVWRAECRESLPRYVTAWVSQSAAAYELGEPYTGAVRETGNITGGWERSCLGILGNGGSYYGMGAEIPSESLVAATIRSAPIDEGKLFVRTVESEDLVTPAVVYFKRSACEPSAPVAGVVYREAIPAPDSQWAPVAERTE